MKRLPIAPVPGLLAGLLMTTPALPLTCDHPARAVSAPSTGLRLTTFLNDWHLQLGRPIELKAELRNEGAAPVQIPGAERCDPALQLTLWDAQGGVAWAQGLPLCQQFGPNPPTIVLAAGSSISVTRCLALAADADRFGQCELLGLPSGTYQAGGTFHGMTLPRLEIRL